MSRAFLVVMDSVGIGGAPDADRFFNDGVPDSGANTVGHIAQALRLQTLHDISTFVATIGGAAVMAASAVILGASKPIREIEIALAIIGAVITLVGVWQAVWRPGERSLDHKRWAARFTIIEDALYPPNEPQFTEDQLSERLIKALLRA